MSKIKITKEVKDEAAVDIVEFAMREMRKAAERMTRNGNRVMTDNGHTDGCGCPDCLILYGDPNYKGPAWEPVGESPLKSAMHIDSMKKVMQLLDRLVDRVLSYEPKPQSKPAKNCRRKSNKAKRELEQ